MQVSEITGSQILASQDQEELAAKNSRFVDHLYEVLTTLKLKKNRYVGGIFGVIALPNELIIN